VGFEIVMNDKSHTLEPKKFKTGSVGWQYSGKIGASVEDQTFSVQSNFLATVIKSKGWNENDNEVEEDNKSGSDENNKPATEETKPVTEESNGETIEKKNIESTEEQKDEHEHEEHEHCLHEEHEEHEEESHVEKSESSTNPEMTRKDFMEKAKNITVTGFGKDVTLKPKQFKTNNVGWYGCAKAKRAFGDDNLNLQVTLTMTIPNSKKLEE